MWQISQGARHFVDILMCYCHSCLPQGSSHLNNWLLLAPIPKPVLKNRIRDSLADTVDWTNHHFLQKCFTWRLQLLHWGQNNWKQKYRKPKCKQQPMSSKTFTSKMQLLQVKKDWYKLNNNSSITYNFHPQPSPIWSRRGFGPLVAPVCVQVLLTRANWRQRGRRQVLRQGWQVTGWTKTVGDHITPHVRNVWMTKWPRKTACFNSKITSNPFSFSRILWILQEYVHENQQNIMINPKHPRWVVLCSWPKTQCHPRAGHRLEFHVSLKIVWRTTSNYTKEKHVWRYIKYFAVYVYAVQKHIS